MKKLLIELFDFQKFEGSEKLGRLIREAEDRFDSMLSDEDLEMVSAAGNPQTMTDFYTPEKRSDTEN